MPALTCRCELGNGFATVTPKEIILLDDSTCIARGGRLLCVALEVETSKGSKGDEPRSSRPEMLT